ncbi:pantetheine-phosphate adenylyltransferase [Trueperella sp. LYQ143]|uniref:pantetheine-phosphate adenylyltransferase n=1 Tax=unclassified Trueperella TaxID=2630174 RepID=UPI0039830975
MTLALCPGSFDPITYGHIDIIGRAARLFDEVVVVVAHNRAKTAMFDVAQRVAMAREALVDYSNVSVRAYSGLIADYARDLHANALVKGVRGGADYDAEYPMALMNRQLSGIETVFIVGDPALHHVASSFVKEIAQLGGRYEEYVPSHVAAALQQKVTL